MRLKLHVGHGKTGSSFLQSWLAANTDVLLHDHLMHYPMRCPLQGQSDGRAAQGFFSMGNGFVLNQILEPDVSVRRKRRWWRRLLRQSGTQQEALKDVIFSHEPWARKLPDQFPHLVDLCSDLEIEAVDLCLFVRDPLDHAISVYGQMVKRHGFCGSLDDWLLIYDFPSVVKRFLAAVSSFPELFHLQVEHYGRSRQQLLPRLQNWLQLESSVIWNPAPITPVNRSLSNEELLLMRWLNARDPIKAIAVGERLVDQLPHIPSAHLLPSQQTQERFFKHWRPIVTELNDQLPQHCQLHLSEEQVSSADESQLDATSSISLSQEQLGCVLDGWTGLPQLLR